MRTIIALKAYVRRSPRLLTAAVFVYNVWHRNSARVERGNRLVNDGVLLRSVTVRVAGTSNTIELGSGARLTDTVISIEGEGHLLRIERDCVIRNSGFYLEDRGNRIVIGSNTTVEGADFSAGDARTEITVGSDCMFSQHIQIRTGDAHSIIDEQTGRRINHARSVNIGAHVWIGADSKILKGSAIGENAIVAIGSIVTGAVEPGSIVGGAPARVLKRGVTWRRERIALDGYDDDLSTAAPGATVDQP